MNFSREVEFFKEIKMFKVAILQKHAIHAKIDKNIESKYVDDKVAYTNGKQEMIDIILNYK